MTDTSKNILLVNYYWPPSGGPAVQRWLSLTAALANLGYNIWVLTVDEAKATYQLYDHSLVAQIHPAVQVVKTSTIEPFGLFKLLFGKKSIPAPGFSNEAHPSLAKKVSRFVRGNFFIPDPRKYWKGWAVQAGAQLIQQHHIAVVITAGPPHSTHFIGQALRQQLKVKWICDFHDLWTDVIYYNLLYHLPIVKKIDQKLERRILEQADRVLTVGDLYKKKLVGKSANINPEKISIIRIGYDEALFKDQRTASTGYFVVSYIGSVAGYYQPEIFFKAIAPLAKANSKIIIQFAGVSSPVIKELIEQYELQANFKDLGYVNHDTAVLLMRQSTALLLINPVTKDEAMVIPGKIYEYLAAGKPIINITKKESETTRLIQQCGAGQTFERTQVAELEQHLTKLYQAWLRNDMAQFAPDPQAVKAFSHNSIAAQLHQVLQGVMA